jgi:hypothetical protein
MSLREKDQIWSAHFDAMRQTVAWRFACESEMGGMKHRLSYARQWPAQKRWEAAGDAVVDCYSAITVGLAHLADNTKAVSSDGYVRNPYGQHVACSLVELVADHLGIICYDIN